LSLSDVGVYCSALQCVAVLKSLVWKTNQKMLDKFLLVLYRTPVQVFCLMCTITWVRKNRRVPNAITAFFLYNYILSPKDVSNTTMNCTLAIADKDLFFKETHAETVGCSTAYVESKTVQTLLFLNPADEIVCCFVSGSVFLYSAVYLLLCLWLCLSVFGSVSLSSTLSPSSSMWGIACTRPRMC